MTAVRSEVRGVLRRGVVAVIAAVLAASWLRAEDLIVDSDTSLSEGAHSFDEVMVLPGATLRVAGGSTLDVAGHLEVAEGAVLLLQGKDTDALIDGAWRGVGVTVDAGSVGVAAGARISADGQGYLGNAGPGAGASDLVCAGPTAGAGAGYGGRGGSGGYTAVGGSPYGDPLQPVDLGSGGGNNPVGGCNQTSRANAGGGAITLHVDGMLELNGAITADAASDLALRLGGGAGGSILVSAGTLTGSGSFSATGADGGSDTAGGGAGGRIAVYYEEGGTFTGFASTSTAAGSGKQSGTEGTIAFVDTSTANQHLIVLQKLVLPSESALSYDALTLGVGAELHLGGGSNLQVTDLLSLAAGSTLLLGSVDREATIDGAWRGVGVTVAAGSVIVESGAALSANGQGYVGRAGPGAGGSDLVCAGATAGAGAGHGGAGGGGGFSVAGGSPYGDPLMPVALGSGGGNNPVGACNQSSIANAGGGAIVLDVGGVLILDGSISADAAAALPERLGGGSGGSLLVTATTLRGAGRFSADGASGGSAAAGGGAGGRVAVYYDDADEFFGFTTSSAAGGSGLEDGRPGTVAFVQSSPAGSHLVVVRDLVFPEDSRLEYDTVTLDNGATLSVGGGSSLIVADQLTVSGSSRLLLGAKNRDATIDGEWRGAGVTIEAGSVTVTADSSITADGQGYVGGAGPGAGASDPVCAGRTAGAGGGHGGAGGSGGFGVDGGSPYGSAETPRDLGSGGGNNPTGACNVTSVANAGGGAIDLTVTDVLEVEGVISASAAGDLSERLGGGAGGSLLIATSVLQGGGTLAASGADGGSDTAGGGGGGRIALSYARGAGFAGRLAADGGAGQEAGDAGSIRTVDTECDGDCNGNGAVAINELIRATNIALGFAALELCPAADSAGRGAIRVDDLIRAVNRALHGCK